MSMKKIILTSVLAGIACMSSTVLAAAPYTALSEKPSYSDNDKSFYIDAGLGVVAAYEAVGGAKAESAGLSWNGAVGYNTSRKFALEMGVLGARLKGGSNSNDLTGYAPYLATKFIVPVSQKFAFNFKLGLTYLNSRLTNAGKNSKSSGSTVLPFTGVGLSYAVTPNIDINLHYQGLVYVIAGAGQAGAGITYHFS